MRTLSFRGLYGALFALTVLGCAPPQPATPAGPPEVSAIDWIESRSRISLELVAHPDTDAWVERRAAITLALGDRTFEHDYQRTFDSLVVAVASLEVPVKNMERASGYINASGALLPPHQTAELWDAALVEWCALNSIDPVGLRSEGLTGHAAELARSSPSMATALSSVLNQHPREITFQLVRLGDHQTKVKTRISGIRFPDELEAAYKRVAQAVDKQLFVDENIDGKVEKRN